MKNQSGMTLPEILLMGAIGVLIGLTFFVVFRSGQVNLSQASKSLRLQQAASELTSEFLRKSKNMGYVCTPQTYEALRSGALTSDYLVFLDTVTSIVMAKTSGSVPWYGYSVVNGVLSQDSSMDRTLAISPNWKPVLFLGDTIYVTNPKPFVLLETRHYFLADFGYLKLSGYPNDSIGLSSTYIACLRR